MVVGMSLYSGEQPLLLFSKFTSDVPVNWQIKTAPKSHKALKYLPLFETLMQFCNDGLAGFNIPSKLARITESPAILNPAQGNWTLRERQIVSLGVGWGLTKRLLELLLQ